jgi:DNA-binding CsgD family transcriptional regulator
MTLGSEHYYYLTMQLLNNGIQHMANTETDLAETDHSKILEYISFTERLFPKVVVTLCRAVHTRFSYVSKASDDILGLSSDYLKSLAPAEFTRLIHHEDIKGFKGCLEYTHTKGIDLRKEYRVVFYYRLTNSLGEVLHVEDDHLAVRNGARKFIHLKLLRNVTHEEKFCGTRVKVYKRINDRYVLLHEYLPEREATDLTARQRDIAQLILMGLSNRQIADRLSLSVYTVKNHKQLLFRKFGINTSLELSSLLNNAS